MMLFFNDLQSCDAWLFSQINQRLDLGWMGWAMPLVSQVLPLVPLLIIAAWLAATQGPRGRWPIAGLGLVFLFSDFITSQILRPELSRPSPYAALEGIWHYRDHIWNLTNQAYLAAHQGSYSLPSCHAANSMGPAVYLWLFFRAPGLIMGLVAVLAGFSRVYLGVHYPGDVLAGLAWGAIGGLLMAWFMKKVLIWGWRLNLLPQRGSGLRPRVSCGPGIT